MRATEILKSEHEVILRVLTCLERLAQKTEREGALDARSAADILDFIASFADACHHGKEEQHLFPMLVKKGLPREVGPVAVMLSEHDEGRALVAAMRRALSGEDGGPPEFVQHALSFVQLLRDHIAKENHVLFPMADGMMQPADEAELLAAFERVEHHDMGPETHGRFLALAQSLCERFDVEWDEHVTVPAGPCCGHAGSGC